MGSHVTQVGFEPAMTLDFWFSCLHLESWPDHRYVPLYLIYVVLGVKAKLHSCSPTLRQGCIFFFPFILVTSHYCVKHHDQVCSGGRFHNDKEAGHQAVSQSRKLRDRICCTQEAERVTRM